ncbi:hypothetical protein Fot_41952 [Forsythia ovata]|uniref:Uncharacterized protein n=1 Tax=Forsythia ovata TaxID=205694 RepID=A0ABD1RJT7_9LAMI
MAKENFSENEVAMVRGLFAGDRRRGGEKSPLSGGGGGVFEEDGFRRPSSFLYTSLTLSSSPLSTTYYSDGVKISETLSLYTSSPSQILVPLLPLSDKETIKSVVGLDGAKDGCQQQHQHPYAQHQNLGFLVVEFEEQLQQSLYSTTSRNGIWLVWRGTMVRDGH